MTVIAITMGDPAGIGPEIVAKCFAQPVKDVRAIVFGDAPSLKRAILAIGSGLAVRALTSIDGAPPPLPNTVDVVQVGVLPANLALGRVDAHAGRASFAYVDAAIAAAKRGDVAAIVTAPIHKEAWAAAGITFPGHTELLADRTGVDDFAMMLFNDELRVILVSIHVSLSDAIRLVTRERVGRTIALADLAARQLGIAKPRIAVAGLNPHAGEGGLFGREDSDEIAPAVADARGRGIDASGPWPGDTVFMQARSGRFDIVVAQYHDQGLIPVKYLGVDHGVNVTVGLPFVRTSVDHGTAFEIAGSGRASEASLRLAIEQAVALVSAGATRLSPT